jgi:lipopolysaccharide export system protein LptA
VVQSGKQARVKAVFYPRDEQAAGAPRPSKPAAVACSN